MTDYYVSGQQTNRLLDAGGGDVVAAADPSVSALYAGPLSLAFLGSYSQIYGDYLDEADNYGTAAVNLHNNPSYANTIYGRVLPIANGETLLQYWFFYYYNEELTVDDHEGDWEMIQIHLSNVGAPLNATYSQHGGGENCGWTHVQRTPNGNPIVYVAHGDHANYFYAGSGFGSFSQDYTDGATSILPSVVDITQPPSWWGWQGTWGSSVGTGGLGNSPAAPITTEPWTDPVTWEADASSCSTSQTYRRVVTEAGGHKRAAHPVVQRSAPATPELVATLSKGVVRVTYKFPSMPMGVRRPSQIIVGLKPTGPDRPALSKWASVRSATGTISIDARAFQGKRYRVYARILSDGGGHSPRLQVPLTRH